ncbi:hypothetical protein Hanom_Chr10g00965591 [Helianthus anomalus]
MIWTLTKIITLLRYALFAYGPDQLSTIHVRALRCKENQCLTIRNPSLGENRQQVKYVESVLKINLNGNTIVTACNESVGSEWGFSFAPFDSIQQDPNDDGKSFKSPIDIFYKQICHYVIGFVVKSFPFESKEEIKNGKDEKKITIMIEDLQ